MQGKHSLEDHASMVFNPATGRWNPLDDAAALDQLHDALDGAEWNADLWDIVAALIQSVRPAPFRNPE